MATEDVKIVITAEDKASGVFSNAGISMGKLAGGFALGQLAVEAFHSAVNLAQDFIVGSFKAFMDAEAQMTVATTALHNAFDNLSENDVKNLKEELGSAHVGFTQITDAMDKAAQSAIKLGFDDEDTSVAFAKLFQVTGDLTKTQNDLALAQDLAAFSGRGLSEAADAVTKVHSGATRVLKEFGISVKEGITVEEALDLLHQRTANSAENMAKTTQGQLKVLGIEWQNLQETVGAALAEAITPFISQLSEWAAKPETQQKIKEIVDAMAQFIKVVLEFLTKHWPQFKLALQIMAEDFRIIISVIKEVWDWFQKVLLTIDAFTNAVIKAVTWVSNLIQQMRDLAKELSKGAINAVGNFGGALGKIVGVKDAIITPGGDVIQTDPADYLIATKNPGALAGGSGANIYITGTFLSESAAEEVGNMIMQKLKLQLRV